MEKRKDQIDIPTSYAKMSFLAAQKEEKVTRVLKILFSEN
jgi:hypothetical protein